jgi:hypothetical protein
MRTLLSLLLSAAPLSAANVYMLLGNGQSLSNGDYGCGAISTAQSWGNQTWTGSALSSLTETKTCLTEINSPYESGADSLVWSSSVTYQPYARVTLTACANSCSSTTVYETISQTTNQNPSSGSPWSVVATQESPLSAAMNNASVLASGFSGIANNFGQSGAAITTWCSSSSITTITNTVTAVKNYEANLGNTLVVVGAMVTAGETDFANASTTYYSNAVTCQSSVQSAIQGITGQTQPVPWIYSQMSSTEVASPYGYTCPDGAAENCIDSYPVSGTANRVPIAQYQLARDSANSSVCGTTGYPACGGFYLTGPKYQFDYGSDQGYHMSAHGYNMLGAESARILACLYAAGFSTSNSCGGVMPKTPITVSGTMVTLNVATPGGLSLDQPSNAAGTTGNWSDGVIPVPYYNGTSSNCVSGSSLPCQHTNYGFQFFTSNGEIGVTSVSVSGTAITLTLASAPTGSNWQLAYGFEGLHYATTPAYGCAWNATTCNGLAITGSNYASGTPHGNIRTVEDFTSLNNDAIYHWMPHFIENVSPQPGPAAISGGLCSGCRF